MCLSCSLGKITLNLFQAIKWKNISPGQCATKNTNTTVKTCLWGCNQILKLCLAAAGSSNFPYIRLNSSCFMYYLFYNRCMYKRCHDIFRWWLKCCTDRLRFKESQRNPSPVIPWFLYSCIALCAVIHAWLNRQHTGSRSRPLGMVTQDVWAQDMLTSMSLHIHTCVCVQVIPAVRS